MPSLYVQDAWTIGNRLTLNLGVRTEKETIPSFRTDIKDTAFEFGFGKKIAPRLGATYDVLGDGRMKAFGSWGRYYDWVKYELARGSFGGDTWLVNYRSLDTLDVNNLSLANMPGTRSLGRRCRDRRVPNFDTIDPDLKPMFQDATNLGIEYQLNPTTALGVNYVHNKLTPRDRRRRLARRNRQRGLLRRQPRRGRRDDDVRDRPDGSRSPTPKPLRQYDALDCHAQPPVLEQLVRQRQPHDQPAVWQLRRAGELGRDLRRRRPGRRRRPRSSRPAASRARARPPDAPGTSTSSNGIRTATSTCAAASPPTVRSSAKFYGSYTLPFGTQVGGFVYAGSGTPMSTVVEHDQHHSGAGERPRRHGPHAVAVAAPTCSSRTRSTMIGTQRVRFELNVINLFNQKTATHIFNSLNKGAGLAQGRLGDRSVERRPREGLRLQGADPRVAVRRERVRSSLRQGRPVAAGHAGSVQRQVPVLTSGGNAARTLSTKGGAQAPPSFLRTACDCPSLSLACCQRGAAQPAFNARLNCGEVMIAVPDGVVLEHELARERSIGVERHRRRPIELLVAERTDRRRGGRAVAPQQDRAPPLSSTASFSRGVRRRSSRGRHPS